MELFSFFNMSFIKLFIIGNPLMLVPFFISITNKKTPTQRKLAALKATLVAAGIAIPFTLFGESMFQKLGISVTALKMAGGILIFLIALQMIMGGEEKEDLSDINEAKAHKDKPIFVFPLAFPFIAGPGTLVMILSCAAEAPNEFKYQLALVMAVTLVFIINFISMLFSDHILNIIGDTGKDICQRLFGLLIAVMALQLMIDGAGEISVKISEKIAISKEKPIPLSPYVSTAINENPTDKIAKSQNSHLV